MNTLLLSRIAVVCTLAIGMSPGGALAQGVPPATAAAPATDPDGGALFGESASLGTEKAQVSAQTKPLLVALQTFIKDDGGLVDASEARAKAFNAAVNAECQGKRLAEVPHCPGLLQQDAASQAAHNAMVLTYNNGLTERKSAISALTARETAIDERLARIREMLSTHRAFAKAAEQCKGRATMEAEMQCWQTQWDGATDSGVTVTTGAGTVVVANRTGPARTPEQAIRDYENSGRARPILRPSGARKGGPPPLGK